MRILTIVLLTFALIACQSTAEETVATLLPTALTTPLPATAVQVQNTEPSPTEVQSVAEEDDTPEPTAVLTNTPPPTPSPPSPTPISKSDLVANEAWWMVTGGRAIWAVNSDGSGNCCEYLFRHTETDEISYTHLRGASSGGRFAFIQRGEIIEGTFYDTVILNIGTLPSGSITFQVDIAPSDQRSESDDPITKFAALDSITTIDNLAWSPDGTKLAYMAISEGGTSDLFVYDSADSSSTRLTSGAAQGIQPHWSPDGRYILHMGLNNLGTGAGWSMNGIWAAAADGSEVITLPLPEQTAEERILGWIADDTYLVQTADVACGWRDLRAVRITDQTVTPLWNGYLMNSAFDPNTGVVAVTVSEVEADCNSFPAAVEHPSSTEAGIFIIQPDGQISSMAGYDDLPYWSVRWDAAVNAFFVVIDQQLNAISPSGEMTLLPDPHDPSVGLPVAAPDGETLAWYGHSGAWISPIDGTPRQISSEKIIHASWSPNGQTLLLLAKGEFYAAHAPDFVPVYISETSIGSSLHSVWVMP